MKHLKLRRVSILARGTAEAGISLYEMPPLTFRGRAFPAPSSTPEGRWRHFYLLTMPKVQQESLTSDAVERFLDKVDFNAPNDCWEWVGAQKPRGYGNLRFQKTYYLAHRFSYGIYKGDVPEDKLVCHTCDNPSCVNPNHLFLGTAKDNTQDMIEKGRDGFDKNRATGQDNGQNTHPENRCYGERNGNSQPTWDDVDEMRQRHEQENLTYAQLADEYNITPSAVGFIIRKERWVRKDVYQINE